MRKLINIELIKLVNYTSFKVIIGLHLALFSLVVFVASQVDITVPGFDTTNLFRFPHVWEFFAWIASWFNLLLAILIIMVTGNEFSFRTFRQHVIDGLDRNHLLQGKLLVILMISLYSLMMVFLSGMVYGLVFSGGLSFEAVFSNTGTLGIYFLQTIAYMVTGLMIVMLVRTTALSIVLFILLRFPLEPIIRSFFDPAARAFFPMKAIGQLTPMPEFLSISSEKTFETIEGANALSLGEMGLVSQGLPLYGQILLGAGYIILFILITTSVLMRRDM
jgi:ABC-2 type transport system permease protein